MSERAFLLGEKPNATDLSWIRQTYPNDSEWNDNESQRTYKWRQRTNQGRKWDPIVRKTMALTISEWHGKNGEKGSELDGIWQLMLLFIWKQELQRKRYWETERKNFVPSFPLLDDRESQYEVRSKLTASSGSPMWIAWAQMVVSSFSVFSRELDQKWNVCISNWHPHGMSASDMMADSATMLARKCENSNN